MVDAAKVRREHVSKLSKITTLLRQISLLYPAAMGLLSGFFTSFLHYEPLSDIYALEAPALKRLPRQRSLSPLCSLASLCCHER